MRDSSGLTGVLRVVWVALLLATPVLLLIPFQDDGGLNTAGWLDGYLAGVAVQIYGLIKVAMLWLVPGLLLTLMMPRLSIQRWAIAAVAGCLIAGWAILPAMGWSEVREILYALPGLAAGIAMGEWTQRSEYLMTGAKAALAEQGAPLGAPRSVSEAAAWTWRGSWPSLVKKKKREGSHRTIS